MKNRFYGLTAITVAFCAVISWSVSRGIAIQDKLDDIQNQKLTQIEHDFYDLKEKFVILEKTLHIKFPVVFP